MGKDSSAYRKNSEQLLNKLSADYRVVKWGFGNTTRTDSIFTYDQPVTDIATALSRAEDFFNGQNLGAVILATDGHFNQGANPLYEQLPLHAPLYSLAIGDSALPKDLKITHAYTNKTVSLNTQFEIRADILATLCNGYSNNIYLEEGGNKLSSIPIAVNTDRYDRSVSFMIKAEKAGLHHYIINLPFAANEKNIVNNRRDIFVEVTDKKKNILIVCAAPHPDVNAISDVLSSLPSYKVTIKTIDNIPASLNDYDVVILHQLPSFHSLSKPLRIENKPVWYILGSQSNMFAFNDMQKMATTSQTSPHDIFAAYNPAFNAFLLPKEVQAVMDKMPPLLSTANPPQVGAAANVLFTQKNTDLPVWVLVQGAVPEAILAGEGIWRWRLYEYKNFNKHEVIDECIRQTVSFLLANSDNAPFKVELPKFSWNDREAITLNAYLHNANNEQVNTPDAQLTITDSAGHNQDFSFERSGTAYRINIGIRAGGNYTYTAKTTYNGIIYTGKGGFVVESMPEELMETGADYPLLYSLAKKYNGAFVPLANMNVLVDSIHHNETIKPLIQTNTESVSLIDRKWFFFLILLFATAEWLLRKYWLAQ